MLARLSIGRAGNRLKWTDYRAAIPSFSGLRAFATLRLCVKFRPLARYVGGAYVAKNGVSQPNMAAADIAVAAKPVHTRLNTMAMGAVSATDAAQIPSV